MSKCGLYHVIPARSDDSKATSLAAKSNKDLTGWITGIKKFSDEDKREMVALLVQINTILLMSSHIYTFGGKVYLQEKGAGIGLRASACLARIVMCQWDTRWAWHQQIQGLTVILFIRYVDDLRLYVNAINRGWTWKEGRWKYCPHKAEEDERTPEERTREELNKSFDDMIDCLSFTTETQSDFPEDTLPTLDVQIKILDDGKIDFRHFTKKMSNNLLLESSTALSKATIFSSLRQDLVRRLLNTRRETDWNSRITIIEEYTQLLSNSGHKYSFAKSIILQALTKYEMMVHRSQLDENDRKYLPLYRKREFKCTERKMVKYTTPFVWYSGEEIKDPFRNMWKSRIKRSFNRLNRQMGMERKSVRMQKGDRKRTTTCLFVPSSKDETLMNMMKVRDEISSERMDWSVKILEKAGQPLINVLSRAFPIILGCPMRGRCMVCKEGEGTKCSKKNIVYEASCEDCKTPHEEETDHKTQNNLDIVTGNCKERMVEETIVSTARDILPLPDPSEEESSERSGDNISEISPEPQESVDKIFKPSDDLSSLKEMWQEENTQMISLKEENTQIISSKEDSNQVISLEPDSECHEGKENIYIGESARTLRQRALEHWNKVKYWGMNSFILRHWMKHHGTSISPPNFTFKVIKTFKEPMSRQIVEALLILEKGTLNLKSEFGTNHLCRLQATQTEWEVERERKDADRVKKETDEELKRFINVMSKKSLFHTKSIKNLISCRSIKRSSTENVVGAERINKKRRMEASTPMRNGDRGMNEDADLISPIPRIGEHNEPMDNLSTPVSDGGEHLAGTSRTNLSDPLRALNMGPRRRHNNTSSEFIIEVLCLEEAASRRGITARIPRPLEWLDLVMVANETTRGVRVDEWSTNSFPPSPSKDKEKEGENERDKASDTKNKLEDKVIDTERMEDTTETGKNCCGVVYDRSSMVLGAIPRFNGEPRSQTPKRKLSPTATTPTGRQRKLTSSMIGSPELRGRLELMEMEIEDTTPALSHNTVGLYQERNETFQTPNTPPSEANYLMEMREPDLISGIGLLTPRDTAQPQNELQDEALILEPRFLLRQNFRQRAQSTVSNTPRQRARRRRINSLNLPQPNTPSRQLKITDLIISQREGNQGDEQ